MSASERRLLRADRELRLGLLVGGLLSVLVAGSGCVETSLREGRDPMDYEPVERPELEPASDGAIFRGNTSAGSFLFFDQKARGIGDLVTVFIEENTSASGSASTETTRDSQSDISLTSDVGFQTLVGTSIRNAIRALGFKDPGRDVPAGSELNVLDSTNDSEFRGEGETARSGRFRGTVTCRVLDVLPGGVFHVKGRRSIVVNHEAQYITIEGLVRREDVSINNTVSSAAVAEMRLSYDGLGVVDDTQRPGWLTRVLAWIYPF